MKSFRVMLETSVNSPELMQIQGINEMLEDVKAFKMFYYTPELKTSSSLFTQPVKAFDMPFEKMWIEFKNPVTLYSANEEWKVIGCGIQEIEPEYQRIYFIPLNGPRILPSTFSVIGDKLGLGSTPYPELYENLSRATYKMLVEVFETLKSNKLTFAENNEAVTVRTRVRREFVKIKYNPREVIYIGSKKEVKPYINSERIIRKPDYAYEVMGHWRVIGSIGKDRNGNRIVKGYTWIRPYTKGKGELMKKVRVIK